MEMFLLREDTNQSAESVPLVGNADSTLRFGFTDTLYHCLEMEIMTFISAQIEKIHFHIGIRKAISLQLLNVLLIKSIPFIWKSKA